MNSKQLNKLITSYYDERDQISAVIAILEAYEHDKEVFEKNLSDDMFSVFRGYYIRDEIDTIARTLVYEIDLVLSGNKLHFWKKSSKKRLLKAYDLAVFFNDLY
jgi:hypothetical protein